MTTEEITQPKNPVMDWLLRMIKGILIGIGFITPGLSGGVLAVVFGVYEPLMRWLGNLKDRFFKNLVYFIPIGIGGALGVVAFSAVVDWAFGHYAAQFTWLFIGFISGTFPSLVKTSGKEGRKPWHWVLLAGMAALTVFAMRTLENSSFSQLTPSFTNWLLSGFLMGLGAVVPGMSPSNFLIYFGLYDKMAAGISHLDFGVIIPILIGGVLCVLIFARLVSMLFKKHYAFMYHFILGIVVGSTIGIIPRGVSGLAAIAMCALLFVVGAVISYLLAKLDEKYSREPAF